MGAQLLAGATPPQLFLLVSVESHLFGSFGMKRIVTYTPLTVSEIFCLQREPRLLSNSDTASYTAETYMDSDESDRQAYLPLL